jgi:hypothetical protein
MPQIANPKHSRENRGLRVVTTTADSTGTPIPGVRCYFFFVRAGLGGSVDSRMISSGTIDICSG